MHAFTCHAMHAGMHVMLAVMHLPCRKAHEQHKFICDAVSGAVVRAPLRYGVTLRVTLPGDPGLFAYIFCVPLILVHEFFCVLKSWSINACCKFKEAGTHLVRHWMLCSTLALSRISNPIV